MATILNNQKSTGSSPYAYYTVTAEYSNRTTYGVTISGTITSHLASDSSTLQTGPTMGLNAFLTLNGVEQSAVSLKSTGTTWSGKTNHNTNYSFTISNLQPTQTSVSISFRVSRTGSAANNYSKGAALKSTTCNSLDIPQGVAQSDFTYISNPTYNGTFTCNITSYSGYDVLEIKNGSTVIQTYNGVSNGTAYSFNGTAQNTILGLIGSSNSSVSLTARLTTYTASGGTSLGYTDRTITVSLPAYTPTITLSSYSDGVSTYNTYKNNATDIIKSLSKPTIVVTLSNNYNNVYNSAVCNSTQGTINGRTVTFSNVTQADNYSIGVTDTRGKYSRIDVSGNSYTASIKTVQWYKGSLTTKVVRPTPTGSTATVTVTPNVYDGTNLKSSALRAVAFTFKYTESGSSEVTVQSSSFTQSGNSYTYTIQNLDYSKTVSWSISGTDKIGVATNGDSNTLQIGMPVFNAYKTSEGEQVFKVNGNERVKGSINTQNGDIGINNSYPALYMNSNVILRLSDGLYVGGYGNYIVLRPNGLWDSTGQTVIYTDGHAVVNGDIWTPKGRVVSTVFVDGERTSNDTPASWRTYTNSMNSGREYRFKDGGYIGLSSDWTGLETIKTYVDTSGGPMHQIAYNNKGVHYRKGKTDDSGWLDWVGLDHTQKVSFNGEWLYAADVYGGGWFMYIPFANPYKQAVSVNLTSISYYSNVDYAWKTCSLNGYEVFESFIKLNFTGINNTSPNVLISMTGTITM